MNQYSHFISSLDNKVHPSWNQFLSDSSVREHLARAESIATGAGFTPPPGRVLRFLTLPLDEMKVLILGQDPYPAKGVATGRAFEVGGLRSWNSPFRNVSLKNIVRAIYSSYKGSVKPFRNAVNDPEFPLFPPDTLFSSWESQGVLLLNTAFTCETGKPGSQSSLWHPFTARLLEYISGRDEKIVWLLWGNHAQKAVSHLNLKNSLLSMHPMMCYPGQDRLNDFLYGRINHFHETRHLVKWCGI